MIKTRRIKKINKVIFLLLIVLILIGCSSKKEALQKTNEENNVKTSTEEIKEENAETEEPKQNFEKAKQKDKSENHKNEVVLETDLNEDDETVFEKANGWTNGNMFDCTWRADNITFMDGIMKLKIDTDGENASPKWSGAEYRSREFYRYGLYEVKMKPIKNDGVVSSFFTYTGPSDNNPWDEIDIEFLGKDTTKVQFNYFTNGAGNHEYLYNLGFDAYKEFHTYGFEWLPDSITWFVDGNPVHTATENIPSTSGKLMMNVWPGTGVDSWLNPFDGTVPLTAEYDWIRITQYKEQNQ